MNTWNGVGRLGRDPEMRYTKDGKAVANFSIAVKKGRNEALWVDCVAWEKLAEIVANNLTKGREVGITGRLDSREWEKDGVKRKAWEIQVTDITFVGPKGDAPEQAQGVAKNSVPAYDTLDLDDDVPF